MHTDTKVEKHESVNSFSKGYGGKYGVQQNTDKSALGFDAGLYFCILTNV
jgi:hypothetical protein